MADHFEEIVNLRLHALETRADDEAAAVKEHFDEQRRFITETLTTQLGKLGEDQHEQFEEQRRFITESLRQLRSDFRAELRAELAVLRGDLGRLDQRLERLENRG